jgi:hypothetical protein
MKNQFATIGQSLFVTSLLAPLLFVMGGCGSSTPDESAASADEALVMSPYNQWNCSFVAGVDNAPITGGAVALKTGSAPNFPPGTVIGNFQQAITQSIGYSPSTSYATKDIYQWFMVEMTAMTQSQKDSLTSLAQKPQDPIVQPGVYSCTFDWGDCLDLGGTPSICKGYHRPRTILAYDPTCTKAGCVVEVPPI